MSWNSLHLNKFCLTKTEVCYIISHFFEVGICSTEQSSSSFLQNVRFSVQCKKPGSETTNTTISEKEICEELNFMEAKKFPKKTIEGAKGFIFHFSGMSMGWHLLTYDETRYSRSLHYVISKFVISAIHECFVNSL